MLGFASIGELTFGGLGHAGAVLLLQATLLPFPKDHLLLMVKLLLMLQEILLQSVKMQMASLLLLQRIFFQQVMSLQFLLAQRM